MNVPNLSAHNAPFSYSHILATVLFVLQLGDREKREGKHTAVFSHTFCHRLHHNDAIKKVSYGALFSPLPSLSSEQQKPLNKLINSYPTNPGYNPYRLKVLHSRTEQAQG